VDERAMIERAAKWVVFGQVRGVFGVRGWLRVQSFTEPLDNILSYSPWRIDCAGERGCHDVVSGRRHGHGLIACLTGIADRDAAAALVGGSIAVDRSALPITSTGEYYWADLEGLAVVNGDGRRLGRVDYLLETGANDVMVVAGERERLIPFVPGEVVLNVDLAEQTIRVAWDPDF
jgi:16S rRNA processing protein RimM